ncbi:MAG: ATP-binding cassette domain-containing protein [Planctomycetota bacterium]
MSTPEMLDHTPTPAAVACEGVHRGYRTADGGWREVLSGASMAVARGTIALVHGPSGAGKTTLLHLLATIDRPDRGRILIHGRDVATMSSDEVALLRRRQIGVVYQDWALIPRFPVWENVAVALVADGVSASERVAGARCSRSSRQLAHTIDERPSRLSGASSSGGDRARAGARTIDPDRR